MTKEDQLTTVKMRSKQEFAEKPTLWVLASLTIAVLASVATQAMHQFGSISAPLRNTNVAINLVMGAVGMMILFPLIHVGIATLWKPKRNSFSRKNIFFGWGVAVTLIQLALLGNLISQSSFSGWTIESPRVSAMHPKIANSSANEPAIKKAGEWKYSQKKNAMSGKITYYASASGKSFPSSEYVTPELRLRQSYELGNLVEIESNLVLCIKKDCEILVRFDEAEPVKFGVINENIIDLSDMVDLRVMTYPIIATEEFTERLNKSTLLRISKSDYKLGNSYLEFDLGALDSKRINLSSQ